MKEKHQSTTSWPKEQAQLYLFIYLFIIWFIHTLSHSQ